MNKGSILSLAIISLLCFCMKSNGQQVPIGGWKKHIDHSVALELESFQDKVYVRTSSGLFTYDTEDQSLNTLSSVTGLPGTIPSVLLKDENRNTLFIGHENGQINRIDQDGQLYSSSIIADANINTSKKINSIATHNGRYFISTDFGLIELSIDEEKEFKLINSYVNLSATGTALGLKKIRILNDTLFVSSTEGLINAPLGQNINLKDFSNWNRNSLPNGAGIVDLVASPQTLYLIGTDSILYEKVQGGLIPKDTFNTNQIKTLSDGQSMQLLVGNNVYSFNGDQISLDESFSIDGQIMDLTTTLGQTYAAHNTKGLISISNGQINNSILPQGPKGRLGSFKQLSDYTLFFSEEMSGFSYYYQGIWDYQGATVNGEALPQFKDASLSLATGNAILLSTNFGLFEWDGNEVTKISTPFNENAIWYYLTTDPNGNTWAFLLSEGNFVLYDLANDQQYLTNISPISSVNDYLIAANGEHYFATNTGLHVFNQETGNSRILSSQTNNGNLPTNTVLTLNNDLEGNIWIGTSDGVCYFRDLLNVLNEGEVNAVVPIFEGFFLFQGISIPDLTIDGGNRLWVVNENGMWLFDEEIQTIENYFTTDNSPLFDDNITSIDINLNNGEVFIRQADQLFSYRSASSLADNDFKQVKVFPNPVSLNYHPSVTITGLAFNSELSITDLAGNVIYKGKANGGTFNWELNNYSGTPIRPGVYLVFALDQFGEKSYQTKFLISK